MSHAIDYIPMDRRQALAHGRDLPERTQGAALFADISGFTTLAEELARELGPLRGAEELAIHLNRVYDAIVGDLHRFGGSVVGFSGDAITCWLDGDDGRRAAACGLAIQGTMSQFASVVTFSGRTITLAVKVAIATGPVRRFVVGDPAYTRIDALTGRTLEHMAAAETHAARGEVLLTEDTATAVADLIDIAEWRSDATTGERFAVLAALKQAVDERPWPALDPAAIPEETAGEWLLPPVLERLHTGRGEFLAELRPAVALFLRFAGIQYDSDPDAPDRLDIWIREASHVLQRYDGSLLQLTIGDKGSYLYAAFGAPIAHEDDGARAINAALELRTLADRLPFLQPVQIGVTRGRMRTGAYGGETRRTYGVLGDAVNLAARLMAAAQNGEILVSEAVRTETGNLFEWESLPDMRVKGKQEPVALARLIGRARPQQIALHEPQYALPMIGRAAELERISAALDQVLHGRGQIVGVTAEAGMGKSRFTAEIVRMALARGLDGLGGECQSYGTNTSYLVWQPIWRGFFGLDATLAVDEQIRQVEAQLARIDPVLVARLPLLAAVLQLPIPENELTQSFSAKARKASLEALLADCMRVRATGQPLLLVLEDCHWLDPLSQDLIDVVGRAIENLPVLLVLVYRPPDSQRGQALRVFQLPYFSEIALTDFDAKEAEQLIGMKVRQFFGEDTAVPETFVKNITTRAAGNPFYIEELLNYLQDLNIRPTDSERLAQLELPVSIHSLILSRIDQLNERQQITLRVASVIGRLFRAAMLWGVYPELGEFTQVEHDLNVLSDLELTPLDMPAPELVYLFKHVMTQEVAYESLPFATRALFHEQIGGFIESAYAGSLDQLVDLLAFHFDHSENTDKRRFWLLRAGQAAQADYANATAVDYYERVLPLLTDTERVETLFELGQVLDVTGDWDAAEARYREALAQAQAEAHGRYEVRCEIAIGELSRKQSHYADASDRFDRARGLAEAQADLSGVAKALVCLGSLALYQGAFEPAGDYYRQSLALRRQLGDVRNVANVLNNLGILAASQGKLEEAFALFEESLAARRTLGDRWALANSLNNLGQLALDRAQPQAARPYLDEAIALQREVGDKWGLGNSLLTLSNALQAGGELEAAGHALRESLAINRELDDRWMLAYVLESAAQLAARRDAGVAALRLAGAGSMLREQIGAPLPPQEQQTLDARLAGVRATLADSVAQQAREQGRALGLDGALALAQQVSNL